MTDSKKPALAPVVTIHPHTLRDVPAVLRSIADRIEGGEFGDATQCAVVLNGDMLEIFAIGDCDPTDAHYLLCCGAARMQEPLLRKGLGADG